MAEEGMGVRRNIIKSVCRVLGFVALLSWMSLAFAVPIFNVTANPNPIKVPPAGVVADINVANHYGLPISKINYKLDQGAGSLFSVVAQSNNCPGSRSNCSLKLKFTPLKGVTQGSGGLHVEVCGVIGQGGCTQADFTIYAAAAPPEPPAPKDRFVYISNQSAIKGVIRCSIDDATGALKGCQSMPNEINGKAMAKGLYAVGSNLAGKKLYLTNVSLGRVFVCDTEVTPLTCSVSGPKIKLPYQIALDAKDSRVYITPLNKATIVTCALNPTTGMIEAGSCIIVPSFGKFYPSWAGMAVHADGGYAYLVNSGSSKLYKCNINPADGDLVSCKSVVGGKFLGQPLKVVINSASTYVYVANRSKKPYSITICKIKDAATGKLGGCKNSKGGKGKGAFYRPVSIAVNSANTYAYILNENNKVVLCDIKSGKLKKCRASGFVKPKTSTLRDIIITP